MAAWCGNGRYQKGFEPLMPGFEYVEYNDVEGLKRLVRRINRNGKLRSLIPGKGRKGTSDID
jgi:acetylornithine aminotransferase